MTHYIFGEVSDKTAEEIIRAVNEGTLDTIWLYSQGGDLMAALAIYDAIVGKGVTVIGAGYVASSGVVIMLAGDKRYGTKHTRFMTHAVKIVTDDNKETTETQEKELAAFNEWLVEMFVARTNIDAATARKMLESDHNFNVEKAIELGLIHHEWEKK